MKRYGVVGLGRMGGNLVRKLREGGQEVLVYDVNREAVAEVVQAGAVAAASLADLAGQLAAPRVIWMMVPDGEPVDRVVNGLVPYLAAGDVLIDGGNSFYRDSLRRAEALASGGVHYLDCGTSGGLEGARHGLCLMVGGAREAFAVAEPLFQAIAAPGGYAYVGPSGAGHFVKMVHNAIEYGMLQAVGEGFELLRAAPYDLDLAQVATLWNHGSVVRSWLMELAARAFTEDPGLERLAGAVGGGTTGGWAVQEAWTRGVPLPTIALASALRLRSRQPDTFAGKVVAALRHQFGGHPVVKK